VRQHPHHGLGDERVFQPDRALAYAEALEVVGDGVDHADFVVEAGDVVEVRQRSHVRHVSASRQTGTPMVMMSRTSMAVDLTPLLGR
jgi:hypothetical protein